MQNAHTGNSSYMKSATTRYILIALLVIAGAFGFMQSLKIQQSAGWGDMRNRVVGARLMMDGKLPYYYHWYPGDSLRYVTNMIIDTNRDFHRVSHVTAAPFFHHLIAPVANTNQYIFDKGAFVLFNFFFLLSVLLALRYTGKGQYHITLLLLVPLMFTDGWRHHFITVQYYMLFGFLLTMISLLVLRKQQVLAGLLFAALFLLRLNTLVFLLPFIICAGKYKKLLLTTFAGVAVYAIFVFANPSEKSNWQEFFTALKDHSDMHMGMLPVEKQDLDILPLLPDFYEGQDKVQIRDVGEKANFRVDPEVTNFKNGYKVVTKHTAPVLLLQCLLLGSIGLVWLWSALKIRKSGLSGFDPFRLVIAGLLFYFLSNFFSTVGVGPYQLPQWWAMAVIYAVYYNRISRIAIVLYLCGIALNFYFLPQFAGRHLFAEILLLSSAVFALFHTPASRPQREKDIAV